MTGRRRIPILNKKQSINSERLLSMWKKKHQVIRQNNDTGRAPKKNKKVVFLQSTRKWEHSLEGWALPFAAARWGRCAVRVLWLLSPQVADEASCPN